MDTSESSAFSELLWEYESAVCEQAGLVASELQGPSGGADPRRALVGYIRVLYEAVRTGHAFREAQDFLHMRAVTRDISPVEVSAILAERFMFEEVVVRAALRSIATMSQELGAIDSVKVNWHALHERFREAAAEAYERFAESELLLEAAYA